MSFKLYILCNTFVRITLLVVQFIIYIKIMIISWYLLIFDLSKNPVIYAYINVQKSTKKLQDLFVRNIILTTI